MNIFAFEMRAQLKTFLIWTVSLVLVFLVFMLGLFHVFMDNKVNIEGAYAGFPPAFAAAFGIVITKMFTYGGFYQFIYTYIAIIGAIMASSIALSAFSREKRSKCVDFLLSKPISRRMIFLSKLLAGLTMLVLANILFVLTAILAYQGNGQDMSQLNRLILASCALFFMQLVFLAIGTVYATFAKKVRSVSGIATGFGFAGFIMTAMYSMLREEAVRFVAPLTYFEPEKVFSNGGFEVTYAVTAAVVIVVCLGISLTRFCKYDAAAD